MNMRNETCVETQTSEVPTRVAFLFISILCLHEVYQEFQYGGCFAGKDFKITIWGIILR